MITRETIIVSRLDYAGFDTLIHAMPAYSTTLPITSPARYQAGDVLIAGPEVMRVHTADDSGVIVIRAVDRSSAHAHATGQTLTIGRRSKEVEG